ncbi:hypothetical protein HYZ80_02090 [Candidatus Parcubacteria bacterium]|nr:hypothetical protein [Candidatus Parcubacteria bacterium]
MPLLPETNNPIVNLRPAGAAAPAGRTQTPTTVPKATSFEWQAPEYTHRAKPKGWRLTVIGAAAIFAIFGALTENPLFVVIVGLGAILILVYGSRQPALLSVRIDHAGVTINQQRREWKELNSFWVSADAGGRREIRLRTAQWLTPVLIIPLANQNPTAVHEYVAEFLPEKEERPSLAELIADGLGF